MTKILRVAILITLLVGAGYIIFNALKIKTVSVSANPCFDSQDFGLVGKFIPTLDSQKIQRDLKNKFPCISEATIRKSFPSKIQIDVKVDAPVAKIAQTDLAINIDGQILKNSDPSLLLIYLPAGLNIKEGQKLSDRTSLVAAQLAALITKTDFHATSVRVIDLNNIAVYDSQETVAIFSSQKPLGGQVDSLQQVVAKAKMSDGKIAKIDLRFQKPVITYK